MTSLSQGLDATVEDSGKKSDNKIRGNTMQNSRE
jgi:hypothetical protein